MTAPKRPRKPPQPVMPPGHFLSLVREHNWPPAFVSRGSWSSPKHKQAPAENRSNSGFDSARLNLPGAVEHTTRWDGKKGKG